MSSNSSKKNFSLLHSFKGHTKGVTAIHLHPISGLAISASLDGMMRVLNLEALNELFSIQVGCGILGMRVVKLCNNNFGCFASLCDGTIKLWKITSVCDFFAVASSKISKLDIFENLEAELEYHYKMKIMTNNSQSTVKNESKVLSLVEQMIKSRNAQSNNDNDNGSGMDLKEKQQLLSKPIDGTTTTTTTVTNKEQKKNESENNENQDDNSSLANESIQSNGDKTTAITTTTIKKEGFPTSSGIKGNGKGLLGGGDMSDKILVTYSTQDLRAFTHKGVLLGRLEPEHVVNGIKALCVSVYQKLLFCLCERDRLRVFDMRRFNFPLVYEFSLKNPGATSTTITPGDIVNPYMEMMKQLQRQGMKGTNAGTTTNRGDAVVVDGMDSIALDGDEDHESNSNNNNKGNNDDEDIGVCCALIDIPPSSSLRAPKFSTTMDHGGGGDHLPPRYDPRGERVPHYIECFLLVGLNTGTIMFLDVLNKFEVILNFPAINGIILDIKYRRRHKELIVYSKDYSQIVTTIRIWKLPDMELIGEINDIKKVCCFSPSYSLNFFALGCLDGTVRLFSNHIEDKTINEIQRIGENHDTPIISICFIDDLRVYCTCSIEGKIKFWDFDKRIVKTIQLNIPTCGVVQNGNLGDIVMAQNHYLLTIPKRIWDEDDALNRVKAGGGDGCYDLIDDSSSANNNNGNAMYSDVNSNNNDNTEVVGGTGSSNNNNNVNNDEESQHSADRDNIPTTTATTTTTGVGQHRRFSVSSSGGGGGTGTADRRSSRRYSKLITPNTTGSNVNSNMNPNENISLSKRRNSNLRKSSRVLVLPSSNSSTSSLRSSDDDDITTTTTRSKQYNNSNIDNNSNMINLDDIERDIILPSLRTKQYQYITSRGSNSNNNNNNNANTSIEMFIHSNDSNNDELFPLKRESNNNTTNIPVVYQPNDSLILEMKHQIETSKSLVGGEGSEFSRNSLVSIIGGPIDSQCIGLDHTHHNMLSTSINHHHPLDVLHPRFLVHKKPPARVLQLEDIDSHVSKYVSIMSDSHQSIENDHREYDAKGIQTSIDNENKPSFDTRRFAQFGLSPRARMTLLNTVPIRPAQPPPSGSMNPRVSFTNTPTSTGKTSPRTSATGMSEDTLLAMKTQEQLILGLSLGINVSNEYKQQRAALNQERQQRFTSLVKRSTMIVIKPQSPLSKDRAELRSASRTSPTILENDLDEDGDSEGTKGNNSSASIASSK